MIISVGYDAVHNDWIYLLESHQTPAFLMMVLADMAAVEFAGGKIAGLLGFNVAREYEKAKMDFVITSGKLPFRIGGMAHPYWQETYYLIARNDFDKW